MLEKAWCSGLGKIQQDLTDAAELFEMSQAENDEDSLQATRRYSGIEKACRGYGIPPHVLPPMTEQLLHRHPAARVEPRRRTGHPCCCGCICAIANARVSGRSAGTIDAKSPASRAHPQSDREYAYGHLPPKSAYTGWFRKSHSTPATAPHLILQRIRLPEGMIPSRSTSTPPPCA